MTNRVSDSDVTGIIEVDDNISLTPFITIANQLTDQLAAADLDSKLSDANLLQIEAWLSAHFYGMRDQQFAAQSTGSAWGTYAGKTGLGLTSTIHGQTAMVLDSTNWLAKRNKEIEEGTPTKATVTWGGTEYSESNKNIH